MNAPRRDWRLLAASVAAVLLATAAPELLHVVAA